MVQGLAGGLDAGQGYIYEICIDIDLYMFIYKHTFLFAMQGTWNVIAR